MPIEKPSRESDERNVAVDEEKQIGGTKRMPIISIPHGGGPMPLLKDPGHAKLLASWVNLGNRIRELQPKAICVVSAHWLTTYPTILNQAHHELFFDYYGFPEETYSVQYPAKGVSKEYQDLIMKTLQTSFPRVEIESKRGLDHGVFIPMKCLVPKAEIPVFQISCLESMNFYDHMKLGRCISSLRDHGILILGSGMMYHNMRYFIRMKDKLPTIGARDSKKFHEEVVNILQQEGSIEDKQKSMASFEQTQLFKAVHPSPDHFLPFIVSAAAADWDNNYDLQFYDTVMHTYNGTFIWE